MLTRNAKRKLSENELKWVDIYQHVKKPSSSRHVPRTEWIDLQTGNVVLLTGNGHYIDTRYENKKKEVQLHMQFGPSCFVFIAKSWRGRWAGKRRNNNYKWWGRECQYNIRSDGSKLWAALENIRLPDGSRVAYSVSIKAGFHLVMHCFRYINGSHWIYEANDNRRHPAYMIFWIRLWQAQIQRRKKCRLYKSYLTNQWCCCSDLVDIILKYLFF